MMGVESPSDGADEADIGPFAETLGSENIAFVDALNSQIDALIENTTELRLDYVLGDVSSAGTSSTGHLHFDLVHNDSKVHCVVFRSRIHSTNVDVENGIQVAVKGDLSYHAPDGKVSLLVEDIVEIGEGVYQQTFQKNKRLLEKDGLLDEETKQPLPKLPMQIGIATSADSDACEDAITSIHNRHPGVDIVVQNTSVQGEEAMLSMMQAISELDDDARVDVVVLTRGGGADKHLRVFNETPICRVVHNTDTPVVAGVGHEADRTLVDEVADCRVMTPTHVGEIVPKKDALDEKVATAATRLDSTYTQTVTDRLDTADRELDEAYKQRVSSELTTLSSDLDHAYQTNVSERLLSLETRLDHALAVFKQQKSHDQEKAEVTEGYERSQRRHRILIAALLLLILLLLGHIVL